jgi:hypothetical protein
MKRASVDESLSKIVATFNEIKEKTDSSSDDKAFKEIEG